MALARKVILRAPVSDERELAQFVEQCIRDGVMLIAIVGPGSTELEERIDWLIVGDGSDPSRYGMCTTSHPDEDYDDVVRDAEVFGGEPSAGYEVVRL
jgi:hypothetical protein